MNKASKHSVVSKKRNNNKKKKKNTPKVVGTRKSTNWHNLRLACHKFLIMCKSGTCKDLEEIWAAFPTDMGQSQLINCEQQLVPPYANFHGHYGHRQSCCTPLTNALLFGKVDIVRWLLDHGADMESTKVANHTPLALAVTKGLEEMVAILLEKDANIQVTTNSKQSLVSSVVASNSNLKILQQLLEHGANPDGHVFNNNKEEYDVDEEYDDDVFDIFLPYRTVDYTTPKESPLHCAVKKGAVESVRLLLHYGANPNVVDRENTTPLLLATKLLVDNASDSHTKYEAIIELLLDHGANANYFSDWGETPWLVLFEKQQLIDVESTRRHHYQLMKRRIELETNVNFLGPNGDSILHHLARRRAGMLNRVFALLALGADPNLLNSTGTAPISFAATHGNIELINILHSRGAKMNAIDPQTGKSPVMVAAQRGHRSVVYNLLRNGAWISAAE